MKQKTVDKAVSISGIALHTGVRAHLWIKPLPCDSGIVFSRRDMDGAPLVRARVENVVDVRRGTMISSGGASVNTVEHVLSALHMCGVDNALVEMDGPEPPILDGSADPYAALLDEAGLREQDGGSTLIEIENPIIVELGEAKIVALPYDGLKITCIVAYGATPLDAQYFSGDISPEVYRGELAGARTFCQFSELEQLLALGLVKGGSLDNAVVMHDGAIISKDGLRYADEFVRHKVLDILGDIYLVGSRIKAHIIAVKPGHPANVQLAGRILESKSERIFP